MIEILPLFKNTQEAMAFGEKATPEDINDLFGKAQNIISQSVLNISFNIQLLNEAFHAHWKDDWYKLNKDS
jgi:hypothetical protein